MSTTARSSCLFQPGDRVSTRGALWTLVDARRGADCVAVRLWGEHGPGVRTLLSPFDRFTRVRSRESAAIVSAAQWVRHAGAVHAGCVPAGGLQAAVLARIQLFAYQLEPSLAVLRHGVTRVLIADGVGLGKTIQAGLLLAELARRSSALRALILVPAGLRDQWKQELAGFFDLATVSADAAWLRTIAAERPADANPWALPGSYVASLDFVKRPEVLRPLEDVTWDLLVVDEAHTCSSRTDRRAAADAIAVRADRVVLLTATPHTDNPAEFAALCSIGRADASETPIVMFDRSRTDVSNAPLRRSSLLRVQPTADEERMHELLEQYTAAVWRESHARGDELARLAVVVLRKRALSSAASLALSVRRRMTLLASRTSLEREQLRLPLGDEDPLDDDVPAAVLGAPGLAHAAREQRWLGAVAEAAHRASRAESKLCALRKLLRRVREPAIIFTEYRDTLERLRRALTAEGRILLMLHGGMSPVERSSVQKRFNEGGAVLLATDAAAEGLNLHAACRLIVHHELPWSVSRLEQRAGRVDRLGQTRRVHELGLVAASTAERFVLERLARRAAVARSRGGVRGLSTALTESRVAEMILGKQEFMQDQEITHARGSDGATRRLILHDEAHLEAARLSGVRDAAARCSPVWQRTRPVASSTTCRQAPLDPGIVLLYVISLTSPEGQDIHAEPLTVRIETGGRMPGRQIARNLRSLAKEFASPGHPALRDAISKAVHRALDFAAPIHQRTTRELSRRRVAAIQKRASVARQLVQAGLFDRTPALYAGEALSIAASIDDCGPDSRTARDIVGIDVKLTAVLVVTRR